MLLQTLKNLLRPLCPFNKKMSKRAGPDAEIIPRSAHTLSRENIDTDALKILYRLSKQGYQAYLIGGGVRDLLLDKQPKDFDIVTNAKPEQIKRLFKNCRLIGRRFRLAHVFFRHKIIEVSTFRASPNKRSKHYKHSHDGMILRDNIYGSIEEDIWRRDFTINAIYYNIKDFSLVDFCGGLHDLKNKQIRIIGEPVLRYREDPVRMLRAIRFAAKLDMSIENDTAAPLAKLGDLLQNISPSRLFDELLKLFHGGAAEKTFFLLIKHQLLPYLLPMTNDSIVEDEQAKAFIEKGLSETDQRHQQHKSTSIAFLFALLLWFPLLNQQKTLQKRGMKAGSAFHQGCHDVLSEQSTFTVIPKQFKHAICDIWALQLRFTYKKPKQIDRVLKRPRFRAALDIFALRATQDQTLKSNLTWWRAQEKDFFNR